MLPFHTYGTQISEKAPLGRTPVALPGAQYGASSLGIGGGAAAAGRAAISKTAKKANRRVAIANICDSPFLNASRGRAKSSRSITSAVWQGVSDYAAGAQRAPPA